MKSKLMFILAFLCLVSCTDKINILLPEEYSLIKIQEFTSFPEKVTVYEITGNYIDYTQIQNYPKYSKVDDNSFHRWINFEELDESDRTHIALVVKEFSERINKENQNFDDLITVFSNTKPIYFSGFFRKTKSAGNRTYNFYDTFNILDASRNRIYRIEYIKDY